MKVKKIIDLTIPISDKTPIYPGDPTPSITRIKNFDPDGYHLSLLKMGAHTGTHVDAPYHFFEDGKKISEIPLQQFMGRGILFDVRGKEKARAITLEDVKEKIEKSSEDDIALFLTGWSEHLGTDLYFEHPYLDSALIQDLLGRGIKTFFIDALSIDPPDGSSFAGHDAILGANGVIGENLTNLEKIDFVNPLIVALPLKIDDCDGSPVRAVAIELEI